MAVIVFTSRVFSRTAGAAPYPRLNSRLNWASFKVWIFNPINIKTRLGPALSRFSPLERGRGGDWEWDINSAFYGEFRFSHFEQFLDLK